MSEEAAPLARAAATIRGGTVASTRRSVPFKVMPALSATSRKIWKITASGGRGSSPFRTTGTRSRACLKKMVRWMLYIRKLCLVALMKKRSGLGITIGFISSSKPRL
ncbi:unnamed protein product [Linum tenue]|uniref:Uncharacterized protein n=1 Tax=Linum tenue TaxID=586396 RepID=A0AAV0RVA9_9ROSI|nr:unnamed protein product [Linum tenue]